MRNLSHIKHLSDVLSDKQRDLFVAVNFVGACGVICFFGTIANIINLKVFFKQGFANAVNISFFGLAFSDLCCVVTLLWQTICLNPLVMKADVVWVPSDLVYLSAAWPHNISGRITSYLTVYITAERCICIMAPLKVKQIFSPPRTAIAVILIFSFNTSTLLPEYATAYLDWKFFHDTNKTLLAIRYRSGREKVEGLVYFLNFASGIVSFIGVTTFTTILIIKLQRTSQWRKEASSGSDYQEAVSYRDKRMVKMVAVIASILIACYIPGVIVSMVAFIIPEFDLGKAYFNSFVSMWSISCIFQALNSSVNIIFYYRMSSKYKETFLLLCRICVRY